MLTAIPWYIFGAIKRGLLNGECIPSKSFASMDIFILEFIVVVHYVHFSSFVGYILDVSS